MAGLLGIVTKVLDSGDTEESIGPSFIEVKELNHNQACVRAKKCLVLVGYMRRRVRIWLYLLWTLWEMWEGMLAMPQQASGRLSRQLDRKLIARRSARSAP
jgi:hypothetical protein